MRRFWLSLEDIRHKICFNLCRVSVEQIGIKLFRMPAATWPNSCVRAQSNEFVTLEIPSTTQKSARLPSVLLDGSFGGPDPVFLLQFYGCAVENPTLALLVRLWRNCILYPMTCFVVYRVMDLESRS